MRLENKAALITGAGRGLGRALAVELARAGARLALVARNTDELDETVAQVRALGGEAHAIAIDLGAPEAPEQISGRAAALLGAIDLVVHNASALGPTPLQLLADTTREDFERVLAVNLAAPFALSRSVAGAMLLRGEGVVVHLSSDAAVEAYPRWGAYSVSKAALDHLARIWGAELEGTGVKFFSVDPGEMNTRMHADAIPDADPSTLADPAEVARIITTMITSSGTISNGSRLSAPRWEKS